MKQLKKQMPRKDSIDTPISIKEIWAAFSGGHDSLVATHVISVHPLFKGVIHLDTGIGIQETQQYVIDICNQFGWDLSIYKASAHVDSKGNFSPQVYEELILRYGFPGPAMHGLFYNRLKERLIRQFIRERKRTGDKPYLAISTGFRASESERRKKYKGQVFTQNGLPKSAVFAAPIIDWSEEDCQDYIKVHQLPKNPVVLKLCMSGECLCGAYAQKNELLAIEAHYPEVAKRIKELEKRVARKFPWGWEGSPPDWWKEKRKKEKLESQGQLNLFCHECSSL